MLDTSMPFVASILPAVARDALIRAAVEAKQITQELRRDIYMDDVIAKIKREYPQFFRD
ncbi:hypothetical protein QCE73_08880 [Caballeronia sp. LZ029]|uniref:hypothetical protein n=1 Tax=Caballeronia sp. LZ029 TaxID=3038564 RepID=UPI002856EFC0|nr:hypothetical protein [Caballeronia sp. LZ029]MDR5743267.1 hypothetical protein [Caballeronia sp. LZ029]